jgi:hypothetical protein
VVPKERSALFCETGANAKNSDLPFFSKQQRGAFGGKLSLQKTKCKVTSRRKGQFQESRCIFGGQVCASHVYLSQGDNLHTFWLTGIILPSIGLPSSVGRTAATGICSPGLVTSDLASPFLIPVPTQQADLDARTSQTVAPIKPASHLFYPQLNPHCQGRCEQTPDTRHQ